MKHAHTKSRAFASLALGALLVVAAGCGDAGDGADRLAGGDDPAGFERLDVASVDAAPSGPVGRIVEKPAQVPRPTP
jgi:hypothetical protein